MSMIYIDRSAPPSFGVYRFPLIDRKAELKAFCRWLRANGRPTTRKKRSEWWGTPRLKPTFADQWTEGQWKGWQARAEFQAAQTTEPQGGA